VFVVLCSGLNIEIFTVVTMKITVLWHVTPCILVDIYVCFGGTLRQSVLGSIARTGAPAISG
jgi:hypothetical protein